MFPSLRGVFNPATSLDSPVIKAEQNSAAMNPPPSLLASCPPPLRVQCRDQRRRAQSNGPHYINFPCSIHCKKGAPRILADRTMAERRCPPAAPCLMRTDREKMKRKKKKRLDAARHPLTSRRDENIRMLNSVCTEFGG